MSTNSRIRVIPHVSERQRKLLVVPNLLLAVVDVHGNTYHPPTLAEAVTHLRSTSGSRLWLDDRTLVHYWDEGDERHARPFEGGSSVVIERSGSDFRVDELWSRPHPNDGQRVFDYTRGRPVELVGRSRIVTLDLEVDSTLKR